ncbi:hypothetical protein [Bacteroides bouchesdurhonensis]|uniref:hypothetical protein n=1 Tax=Bacteroides bouchesdurhonensis TaxID=1841855 RepID=UPI0011DCFB2C|nr:hypothetical protein [Bacteroides bouchesdurhonensis]
MATAGNKADIINNKHPNNNNIMNKLTIHRTTKSPFFKKETPALPPAVKGQAGALPIQAYSRTAANALLNNVHPNQWKLYRQQCRPPPFPSL